MITGNWNYPTLVRFGPGRRRELPALCREVGIARPLVVTDPGMAKLPAVAEIMAALESGGLPAGLFSEVRGNPVGKNVDDGVAAYRAAGCDGVIALGGGSALDVGKAIALMVGQTRPIWDFEDVGDNDKRVNVAGMAPCIAVPTTAGTGSEVGRSSVITDEQTRTKKVIFHANMMPKIALCDPELTLTLPRHLTAATGMDAFAHCLEAYCAPGFHPMADGIAVEGIRLVREWLVTAVNEPAHLHARAAMMAASMMGATAFQKGLGAIHALSHPVGARFDAHHGLLNAVFMPYVLVFNEPAIHERITRLSSYLGLEDPSPKSFLRWVLELRAAIGIPHTLADLGVTEEHIAELAPKAAADPTAGGNPVPLDEVSLAELFQKSLRGELPT
jgi:alcohol dehydrogenase class IV